MGSWNASPHPISDIRDWQSLGRLEIQPDFQRNAIWSTAARIMLIDTILRRIPMPKILVASALKSGSTHRIVIDGQQRINAILDFLSDKYPLESPYSGEYVGRTFSQLPDSVQANILSYPIDFNEALDLSESDIREVYSRVNKYTVALNKQELRRADYPGQFLDLSEELAIHEFFNSSEIFTVANRRRLGDVEFVSELLIGLMAGPQDKKGTLDEYYQQYAQWDDSEKSTTKKQFEAGLVDVSRIFNPVNVAIRETRFRQKADFYSLFLAIARFLKNGRTLDGKDLSALTEDFHILHYNIEPTSHVDLGRAYAIRCVSDANSLGSRRWRVELLSSILAGTYLNLIPHKDTARALVSIQRDLTMGDPLCPAASVECPICEKAEEFTGDLRKYALGWAPGEKNYQLSNSRWIHADCLGNTEGWQVIQGIRAEDVEFTESADDLYDIENKQFEFEI